jgi:hypothetical protein
MNKKTHQLTTTLAEIKEYLRENYKDGCICPACKQVVKQYKRNISSTMAYCMIIFVKHCRKHNQFGFVNFNKVLNDLNITPTQRADWQKLVYFKLIEPETTTKGDPKNGNYRIHARGFDFIEKDFLMPKFCNVYNGNVLGYSMEQITIREALKNKFNFDDLMNK